MPKKTFFIVICILVIPAFFALAQDGTSGGTSDGGSVIKVEPSVPIVSDIATSSTPTTGGAMSGGATPREEPVISVPESTTPAPVETEMMPILSEEETKAPEEKPKSNLFIFLAAATVMLFAVLGGILQVKKAQDKKYEKKDDSRCFNIKKLMEDKLNEATDLRGKIEGAAKDKARGIVRDSITGTPLADIMAVAEHAEKEYNRLKKLYEQCVIDIEKKELHMPISIKGIIFENGKVWLRKNKREEWELPGGKLDEGEQPKETLMREIKEELGFDVDVKEAVDSYVYEIKKGGLKVFVVLYVCDILKKSGEFGTTGGTESAEFKLFAQEEIANLNMPQFYKDMIKKAQGLL